MYTPEKTTNQQKRKEKEKERKKKQENEKDNIVFIFSKEVISRSTEQMKSLVLL